MLLILALIASANGVSIPWYCWLLIILEAVLDAAGAALEVLIDKRS